MPQLSLSLCKSTHSPLQLARPIWQLSEHVPFEHTYPCAQACAHAPQLSGSRRASTHPSAHWMAPGGQVIGASAPPSIGNSTTLPHPPPANANDTRQARRISSIHKPLSIPLSVRSHIL